MPRLHPCDRRSENNDLYVMMGQHLLSDDEYEVIMNRVSMKSFCPTPLSSTLCHDDRIYMQSQGSSCCYTFNDPQYRAVVSTSNREEMKVEVKVDNTHPMIVSRDSNSNDYHNHNKMTGDNTVYGNCNSNDSNNINAGSFDFIVEDSNGEISEILRENEIKYEYRANFSESNMSSPSVIPNRDNRCLFLSPAASLCSPPMLDVADFFILDDGDEYDLLTYFGIKVSRRSGDDCAESFNEAGWVKEQDGKLLA